MVDVSGRRDPSTPVANTFERYLADKGKGPDNADGNYRSDAERELDRFHSWCTGESSDPANAPASGEWTGILPDSAAGAPGPEVRFTHLDTTVFADYARYLASAGHSNNTVRTYYAYVASWCRWAHKQGYLPRHHARESDAEDPLPDDDGRRPGDQQSWSPEQRDRLTRYVDRAAAAAIDAFGEVTVPADERGDVESDIVREKARARMDAVKRCRERVLVYLLAYTGLRVSEFLNDPDDDRPGRNGLRWRDVSLPANHATVFRKKQQWDEASLPDPVVPVVKRYRQLLDPPEDWPVFTTLHRPTLAAHVTEGLHARNFDDDRVATLRDAKPDLLVAAEYDLDSPPAVKPNGARRILKRLCEDADIDVDSDRHDYLAPHGGRRGAGEILVREFGYAAAARYLDNSEQQVREAYQHIEAGERADMATEAFSQTDQRVSSPDTPEPEGGG